MKKTTLFFLIFCCTLLPLLSFNVENETGVVTGSTGNYPTGALKSIRQTVILEQTAGKLVVYFTSNIGQASVCVVKLQKEETVFYDIINTGLNKDVSLNTSDWESGIYIITVIPDSGNRIVQKIEI